MNVRKSKLKVEESYQNVKNTVLEPIGYEAGGSQWGQGCCKNVKKLQFQPNLKVPTEALHSMMRHYELGPTPVSQNVLQITSTSGANAAHGKFPLATHEAKHVTSAPIKQTPQSNKQCNISSYKTCQLNI